MLLAKGLPAMRTVWLRLITKVMQHALKLHTVPKTCGVFSYYMQPDSSKILEFAVVLTLID